MVGKFDKLLDKSVGLAQNLVIKIFNVNILESSPSNWRTLTQLRAVVFILAEEECNI